MLLAATLFKCYFNTCTKSYKYLQKLKKITILTLLYFIVIYYIFNET